MRQRSPIDPTFLWMLIGICVFGLAILVSVSGPFSYQKFGSSWYMFRHQLLSGVLPGMILFWILSRIDYRFWKRFAVPALVASVVVLLLVFMPGVGLTLGGAGRWVHLGPISFQPSEFVKIMFLIYVSAWLDKRYQDKAKTLEEGLFPFLGALGIVVVLLILQPNTGSMSVIAGSAFAAYFIAGAPIGWFAFIGAGSLSLIALLIKLTPYRAARFMTFLHPELDPQGIGYHINQAFLAIGSGGLFGLGYGHSRQKYLYLPEVAGDSVFAVMAEELGFILTLIVMMVFGYFISHCLKIARNAGDSFGRFLGTGIACWIAIQAVFNAASMMGLMPITGVTLPFVSYGSSAYISLMVGMGIMASISRDSSRV